jgi:hypothetical protein
VDLHQARRTQPTPIETVKHDALALRSHLGRPWRNFNVEAGPEINYARSFAIELARRPAHVMPVDRREDLMKSGNGLSKDKHNGTYILVEGPSWGDAEFYGRWLLDAAKVNQLLQQAKRDDPDFRKAIDALEMVRCLDFGIMATVFVSQFTDKKFHTFVVNANSVDLIEFVLMAEMGFFALTGDRYQMTTPSNLDMDKVKQAHLKLARTEDEDWIHPERLVVDIPYARATTYQRLLNDMNQEQRLADRRLLLFLD